MLYDYFLLAFKSIKNRKLRSWLTMMGVFIGIAAVVSLISLSQGMQEAVTEQFLKGGANRIMIFPGKGFGPVSLGQKLFEEDLKEVKKTRGIDNVAHLTITQANVKFRDEAESLTIHGMPTSEQENQPIRTFVEIEEGRFLRNNDRSKAIVGVLLTEDKKIFQKGVRVRDKIYINGKKFEVVGIRKKFGQSNEDSEIFIPYEEAKELFNLDKKEVGFIIAEVLGGYDASKVADDVKKNIREQRNEEEGEETFDVQTAEETISLFGSILSIVNGVLVGIAAISLLVGAVGIMNTMFMTVLERTREIGVMKAVGAKQGHILMVFLFESGFYGLGGGSVGALMGIGIAKAIEFVVRGYFGSPLLKASISPTLISGVLIFSFIIGCLSGIAPALRASRLDPVNALRYE